MKEALGWLFLGALAYFLFQTEGPTPEKHWEPYATNKDSGKFVWVWAGPYATRDECEFNADKATQMDDAWRKPAGCLYFGYQNPYVQWVVNAFVAPGHWKCIARITKRENFNDAVYEPILRDGAEEGDGWKCYLGG
jgi:hypothetical protein